MERLRIPPSPDRAAGPWARLTRREIFLVLIAAARYEAVFV
jgi:hypothetical protein